MTEVQDNPYTDHETYAHPPKWVMQVRHSLAEPFTASMIVPSDLLDRFRDRVDKYNSDAGYTKYRIVSR